MMQILDQAVENQTLPLFRLAFRPLFLCGAAFSVLAMLLWSLTLAGGLAFRPYGGGLFWHSHEMLFGFVAAIVVGFLLTAVQNWTAMPSLRGPKLALLFALWLLPRLLILSDACPWWLLLPLDLAFLPMAGYWLAKPLIAVGQTRNLFFVPILILLSAANLLMHLSVVLGISSLQSHGYLAAIWLVILLMSVLGGRVIPFFTANGTGKPKVEALPWLEWGCLGSTWLAFIIYASGLAQFLQPTMLAGLLAVCALCHAIRCARWRFGSTLAVPLLWSLHLAYWFIPIGLALMALSYATAWLALSTAFHAVTVGAMGGMILSMMARVSLGHTGRLLQPPKLMSFAFALMVFAALVRVFGQWLLPQYWHGVIALSAAAWLVAYCCFVGCYFAVLTQPRVDGRPG